MTTSKRIWPNATYVAGLSRSLFWASEVALDTPGTARSKVRHDPLQLWASPWVELRHRSGTRQ